MLGSSNPLRGSRESRVLASESFLKVSVSVSHASLRPTFRAMFPRWQVLVERWAISMSLVGRARDLTIEHGPVVACGIGRVSFCFLDPFSGLASVPAIHVGHRDELHVCLREEGVEELSSPAARANDAQPDLPVRGSRPANGGST